MRWRPRSGLEAVGENAIANLLRDAGVAARAKPDIVDGPARTIVEVVALQAEAELQSRRIVRMDRGVLITETHRGFVAANAGTDQSNVPGEHFATVLPSDPDASAHALRNRLNCGALLITDSFGRPWREGLVNVALGVAGIAPLVDYRGQADASGKLLQATLIALADELASAAELVMGKSNQIPVAIIRGIPMVTRDGSGADLIRPAERDLFR